MTNARQHKKDKLLNHFYPLRCFILYFVMFSITFTECEDVIVSQNLFLGH